MKEYRTITKVAGPLVFLEKTHEIAYGELVEIVLEDGTVKSGQVLDTSKDVVVVQVFEGTEGRYSPVRCGQFSGALAFDSQFGGAGRAYFAE